MHWVVLYGFLGLVMFTAKSASTTIGYNHARNDSYDTGGDGGYKDGYNSVDLAGQIYGGLTVREVLETLGRGWNADSFRESARLGCVRLGDPLNELSNHYGEELVRPICDMFEPDVDIEKVCHGTWDAILRYTGADDLIGVESISITINNHRRREETCAAGSSPPETNEGVITLDALMNIYDPCTESGARKINNIVFALMDWLGPYVLNSFYDDRLEAQSTCGSIRYILNMDPVEFLLQVTEVLKFPAADFLEYLHAINICNANEGSAARLSHTRAIKQLLIDFSDQSEAGFCQMFSEIQSREAYLDGGKDLAETLLLGTVTDAKKCVSLLSMIASLNAQTLAKITGRNLTTTFEKSGYCSTLLIFFLTSHNYDIAPFVVPSSLDTLRELFKSDLLPDIMTKLIRIYGAAFHANRVVDGVGIYCTVFGNLTSALVGDQYNVKEICSAIEDGELASIEDMCHSKLNPPMPSPRPVWLRAAEHIWEYPQPTAFFLARRLLEIDNVNKNEMCAAFQERVDRVSLRRVMEVTIDSILEEGLPSVPGICKHWREFRCFVFMPFCLAEDHHSESSEFDSSTQYPVDPSAERVFDTAAFVIATAAGYERPGAFCDAVIEGIDEFTGRPSPAFVEIMRNEIIEVFYEPYRCSQIVDNVMSTVDELTYGDYLENFYILTGYENPESLCRDLARFFSSSYMPASSEAPSSTPPRAFTSDKKGCHQMCYNIAVYCCVNSSDAKGIAVSSPEAITGTLPSVSNCMVR